MKATNTIEEISEASFVFKTRMVELRERSAQLQEVVKREVMPRIDRLETMIRALKRDISEVDATHGADLDTTAELAATIDRELSNLIPEVEALLAGNPTTVSAVFDASLHAVEKAGKAIRKATAKLTTLK